MTRRALVIVGKAPDPGSTKTRLCPALTLTQAAEVYRAFLVDTVAMALELEWERVTLIYPPTPRAEPELRGLLPPAVALHPQRDTGLGAALSEAFASHLTGGFDRVVLIGSDNPTLPAEIVEAAAAALDSHELVVGPSADGGYYLIGMDQPHPRLFERITWSTEVVYQETLDRAAEAGLSVASVDEWYDVDTVDDLRRLHTHLRSLPEAVAPATRRVLDELSLWPALRAQR